MKVAPPRWKRIRKVKDELKTRHLLSLLLSRFVSFLKSQYELRWLLFRGNVIQLVKRQCSNKRFKEYKHVFVLKCIVYIDGVAGSVRRAISIIVCVTVEKSQSLLWKR